MIEEILSSRETSLSNVDCSQSSIFPSDRQDKRFTLRAAILHAVSYTHLTLPTSDLV